MRKRGRAILKIALVIILGSYLVGFAAYAPNLSNPDRLKGKVKSMIWEGTLVDEAGGQFLEGERYHIETADYDESGHRIRVERTSEWGCDDLCPAVARTLQVALWPFASQTVRSYDSNGNISQTLEAYSASGKWLERYEYDSHGNWIKKTMSLQDPTFFRGDTSFIPREVHYRTIVYYQ